MLNVKFAEAFRSHWEKGQEGGARLLLGGAQWDESNRTDRVLGEIVKGAYMQPCIWADVTRESWLYRHEVYGPTVNLCTVDSFEAALESANGFPHGLTGSLHTQERRWIEGFQAGSRTGAVAINAPLLATGPSALESWTRLQVRQEDPMGHDPNPGAIPSSVHTIPTPVDWAALD
jgi:acyl-CoA reductase-like NAD-dependent aldehyde dehydrogenase